MIARKPMIHNNPISHEETKSVVLIHGMAASANDWIYLIPELRSAGYRPLAPDLLGHGNSQKPDDPGDYHFDCLYDHLANWLSKSGVHSPVWLVGHSLGGALSLRYALEHPKAVRGLVLIDPFYSPRQLASFVRYLGRFTALGVQFLRFTPGWVVSFLATKTSKTGSGSLKNPHSTMVSDYKRASPQILRIPATIPDFTSQLPAVDSPTLVIWGEQDITLKPASFPPMVKAFPYGYGLPIPNCGHQPHLSASDVVNQSVVNFLNNQVN